MSMMTQFKNWMAGLMYRGKLSLDESTTEESKEK